MVTTIFSFPGVSLSSSFFSSPSSWSLVEWRVYPSGLSALKGTLITLQMFS